MKNVLLPFATALVCNAFAFKASVAVHVVDGDSGAPVPGFCLLAAYDNCHGADISAMNCTSYRRACDDNGVCKFTGFTNLGSIHLRSQDKSYYEEHELVEFTNYVKTLKRYVPDHQDVTFRVWKVGRQVPLVVRRLGWSDSGDFFARGCDILRFDCLLGDYLPPVGTGVVADVEFRRKVDEEMDGDLRLKYHGEMTTTFLGDGNGFVEVEPNAGSRLKIRSGVDADFERTHVSWIKEDFVRDEVAYLQYDTRSSYDKSRCYCFRIRTVKDDCGAVTNAFYGKIYGDIHFAQSYDMSRKRRAQTMHIARPKLLYYVNPTPMDKNLEFDQRHNRCPGGSGNYYFDY